jgi:hypothetical protein
MNYSLSKPSKTNWSIDRDEPVAFQVVRKEQTCFSILYSALEVATKAF